MKTAIVAFDMGKLDNVTGQSCKSWDKEVVGQFQVVNDDPGIRLAIAWCTVAVGLLVVFMNFVVICSILRAKNLRHNSVYIFVFSLAVADLLAAIVFVSIFLRFHLYVYDDDSDTIHVTGSATELYDLIQSNGKKLNQYLIELMMVTICFTASVGSLALTAIDRFIAVLRPFDHHAIATRGRCIRAILLMWLCSIGVAVLPVSGWRCDFSCDGFPSTGCSQLYPGISRGYLIFYVSFIMFLLVFVTCMYLYIFTIVWRHYKKNCCTVNQKVHNSPNESGLFATWPKCGKAKAAEQPRSQPDEKLSRPSRNINTSARRQLLCDSTLPSNAVYNEVGIEMDQINHGESIDDKAKGTFYEVKKDSFRFVLIVDDGAGRIKPNREHATGFRGIIYVGDNVGRSKSIELLHNPQKMENEKESTASPKVSKRDSRCRSDQARNQHQMQIIQTLLLILGLLVICWVPSLTFMVLDLVMTVDKKMKKAFAFLAILTLFNSAANPVIYAIRLHELRSIARRLLCCVPCKR